MDGQLTLDMLDSGSRTSILAGETTRAFEQIEQRHVTELLAAAHAAEFFTRPDRAIGPDPGTCLWRVRIVKDGRSRELVIPDKNAGPEWERLARAARACVRDRQVFGVESMPGEMRQALAMSPRDDDARQVALDMDSWTKERLRELTDSVADDPRMAAFYADIADDNVKIRLRFLSTFPALTADALADADLLGTAGADDLDRWLDERRVFSMPVGSEQRFPLFQFANGHPIPVIADALAALPADLSAWETAFWFVSSNSWLGGPTPLSFLVAQPDAVVEAAWHERDEIAG